MRNRYYHEYEIGEKFESRGRTLTEADIVNFAGLTGDYHPLHTDAEFAEGSQFGERIAHGLLILSIAASLAMEYNEYAFYYGFSSVKFVEATYIGDTIRVKRETTDKTERSAEYGVVTTRVETVNQDGEVVLTYDLKEMIQREPT